MNKYYYFVATVHTDTDISLYCGTWETSDDDFPLMYIRKRIAKQLNVPTKNWHQASPRPTTAPGTANGSRKRHLLHNIRKSEKNSKL
jgi:hypothetical protein